MGKGTTSLDSNGPVVMLGTTPSDMTWMHSPNAEENILPYNISVSTTEKYYLPKE